MLKELRDELRLRHKMAILEYARICGNVLKACRSFEVPKSSFYVWKKAYDERGRSSQ